MKIKSNLIRILLVLSLQFIAFLGIAQVPGLINYQGIVRDDKGFPVSNQAIALKFEVLQGSATGPVVYTDNQASGVITNAYGLFTTQIGKTSGFGQVNWQQGVSYYLKIWVDPAGGTNLVALGNPQQITSVPYAFHAQTVPATYSNNILSIGNRTFDITPSITSVPNTSITLSGLGTITSAGTNSFDINIPAPTFTNTGQQIITGTYPNFTVNTPTVPASSVPTIAITNNAATTSTVQSSGNSFSINVPPPSFTNTGQNIITGTYPNFTVNTPTVPASSVPTIGISNNAAAGSSVTSSGNSFSINVPPPTFTNAGPATITGAYPNYTINSPTGTTYTNGTGISITSGSVINNTSPNITPTVAVTTTASGAASVSSLGSSFNINVPPPAFTNAGPATITGTYPNYTINSPVATTYTNGTGISITSGSVITNTSPNITPTIAVTASAAAGPSVTSTGSSFNLNIPPNTTSWSLLGNAGTSFATNYIGTSDNVALQFRVNATKSGGIDHILNNAYFGFQSGFSTSTGSLNAALGQEALRNLTTANRNTAIGYQALRNNTGGSNTGIGASALTTNTTGIDNTAVGKDAMYLNGSGSYNVGLGSGVLLNHTSGDNNVAIGRDALNGNTSGANNVVIGSLAGYANTSGSGNVFIGYNAGYNETGSNKFILANTSTTSTPLMYGDFANGKLGINTTTGQAIFAVDARSLTTFGGIEVLNARDQIGGALPLVINAVTNGQTYNSNTHGRLLRLNNMTQGVMYDFGIGSTGNLFLTSSGNYTNPSFNIATSGEVGIGTNAPTSNLHINEGSSNSVQIRMTHTASVANGFLLDFNTGAASILNYNNTPLYFGTNGANRMVISNTGNVNIGTFNPAQKLNVDGNISLEDAAGSTASARTIGFPTASTGNHGALTIQAKSQVFSGTAFSGGNLLLAAGDYNVGSPNPSGSFGGNVTIQAGHNLWPHTTGALITFEAGVTSNIERMRIDGATGNVGIGTTAPTDLLTVNGSASKPGGGSWAVFSDRRLKKDINSYKDGLKELMKIEPVWYTYNGEANLPQETFIGVIAQDLQLIAPYMVKETNKGVAGAVNYLSVDNSAMTYMLINAVKEQQKQIEELKKTVADLLKNK